MNLHKNMLGAGVVGLGLCAAAPQEANAGSFYFGVGSSPRYYSGYGTYNGLGRLGTYGLYPGYGGVYGSYPGYGYSGRVWQDTSHYHYYPGRYVPHGDHLNYIPGHYGLHRDGHWNSVGGWGHGHHH